MKFKGLLKHVVRTARQVHRIRGKFFNMTGKYEGVNKRPTATGGKAKSKKYLKYGDSIPSVMM
jgi:hypothetical protein